MEKTTQQDSSVTYFQGNFSGLLYVCQNKYTRRSFCYIGMQ